LSEWVQSTAREIIPVTMGWATEPAAPDENKQTTAESEMKRPFKPPGGWRPKRVNGELVYWAPVA